MILQYLEEQTKGSGTDENISSDKSVEYNKSKDIGKFNSTLTRTWQHSSEN